MIRGYGAATIRAAEAPLLAAGVPLMRHAALALAYTAIREIRERGQRVPGSVVLSLVGGGNNGGDALWAAVELQRRGVQAWAALCAPRVHEEGLAAARAAGVRIVRVVPEIAGLGAADVHAPEGDGADPAHTPSAEDVSADGVSPAWPGGTAGVLPEGAPTTRIALADLDGLITTARRAGVWLDGLAGIGVTGALREPLRSIVLALDAERQASPDEPVVIAVDTPSGVGDTGAMPETVLPAHVTVTMGAAKAGLLLPPADSIAGRIDVVDLGLPLDPSDATVARWTGADTADTIAWPRWEDHKYTRGVVGIAAGTDEYPGAGRLACEGALACGVGMVRYLGEVSDMPRQEPEVVTAPGRVQAMVLGPGGAGLGLGLRPVPLVLDAGAAVHRAREAHVAGAILTPHAGELSLILNVSRQEIEAEPAAFAARAAVELNAVVLLKGASTVVAAPDGGPILTVDAGTSWLATAGTGDVLAGITGALLAGRQARAEEEGAPLSPRDLAEIAASAAWLHGAASHEIAGPLRASDLPRAVTTVLRRFLDS